MNLQVRANIKPQPQIVDLVYLTSHLCERQRPHGNPEELELHDPQRLHPDISQKSAGDRIKPIKTTAPGGLCNNRECLCLASKQFHPTALARWGVRDVGIKNFADDIQTERR